MDQFRIKALQELLNKMTEEKASEGDVLEKSPEMDQSFAKYNPGLDPFAWNGKEPTFEKGYFLSGPSSHESFRKQAPQRLDKLRFEAGEAKMPWWMK